MLITIHIEAMTGEKWTEQVSAYDEVIVLKKRVFKRKGIPPSRQALVFCGSALADTELLITAGLRNDSLIKFVVMTRTGPIETPKAEEVALSDDPSDWEMRGRRVFSAAEDTSAKESAGETERDDEDGSLPRKITRTGECFNRRRTRSQNNSREVPELLCASTFQPCSSTCKTAKDQDVLADLSNDDEAVSESLSEVSSGMLVCDLSNEFRKIKIKKHRHPIPAHVIRQRNRSKTRGGEEREVSSSEESEAVLVDPSVLALCPQNPHRKTMQRVNAATRCTKCAYKVTNPFFCRCGKTLCPKHRIHTCARQRTTNVNEPRTTTKLQEVSD